MADTISGNCPVTSTLMVCGTRNQFLPRANIVAISEEPMPVAKAPNAPALTVCESAPVTISPGQAKDSATI